MPTGQPESEFPRRLKQQVRTSAYRGFPQPPPFDPSSGHAIPLLPANPLALFAVLEEHDDYLVCKGYEPLERFFYNQVAVAKPHLLQRSTFDGLTINGVTYAYSSSTVRTATSSEGTVTQTVSPEYYANEVISCARSFTVIADHTGLRDDDGAPIEWVDVNSSGRLWLNEDLNLKRRCRFTLDSALTTADASVAATITSQRGPGTEHPDTAITVHNLETSSAGTYVFEGDSGDAGWAEWDSETDWDIENMECP